jgi:ABC-2 type transport system permease protein
MIAAILRAQWLSMRWGRRRGAALSVLAGCLWYGFWCLAAFGVEELARIANASKLATGLPLALPLVWLYWQVVPVVSASMGAGLDMRKLLVYPAPHGKLFLVETLLRLATGGEMLLVLAAGAIGLLRNPWLKGILPAARILFALLLYVAFNALLASGLRSLLERLLARRHVREILIFLLVLATAAPRMLLALQVRPDSLGGFAVVTQIAVFPWAAAARAVLGRGETVALGAMALWVAAAGWFGRAQFERNLRYDVLAAQATPAGKRDFGSSAGLSPRDSWSERLYRLPSRVFRDPLAAIVEKELRSLARTPRFRMVFVMGFAFGLVVWLPVTLGPGGRNSWIHDNFLAVMSVYALMLFAQITYSNCFGLDRSAVEVYFAAPQPIRATLVGKNIASLIFIYLDVLILSGMTAALRVSGGVGKVIETLLVVGVCSLYLIGSGNVVSVHYPRAMRPEKTWQNARYPTPIYLFYPLVLAPVALAYLARYALASEVAFGVALLLAAGLGGVVYWIGLDSAVEGATKHREQMLQELSGGDGPIEE